MTRSVLDQLEAEAIFILREGIRVAPPYFARPRSVIRRQGAIIALDDQRLPLAPGEHPETRKVRFRTPGCNPLTKATESEAETLDSIIDELRATRYSERQGRLIDTDEAGSMEKKKREGYL